jgi:hypothetical protein
MVRGKRERSPGLASRKSSHQVGIASDDDNKVSAIVLHSLHERIDRFSAKVRAAVLRLVERIGLVDEQYAAERPIHDSIRFRGRLTLVHSDQVRAIRLDELASREDA